MGVGTRVGTRNSRAPSGVERSRRGVSISVKPGGQRKKMVSEDGSYIGHVHFGD